VKAWLGDRRMLLLAFVFQGAGLAAMPFARSLFVLLGGATIYALGNGLLGPAINGWCSRVTPERRQGAMFGLLQSARSLGFMVGPALGGALFDFSPTAPYLLAGAVSALAAAFVAIATRRSDESVEVPR
jgi:MFS family permease